jgi:hypothetical protein
VRGFCADALAAVVAGADVVVAVFAPAAVVLAALALLPVLVLVLVGVCLEPLVPDALELGVSSTSPVSPAPPPPHPAPVAPATATTPARSRPLVMLPDLELVLCITPSYAGRNPTGRSLSNLVRRR